MKVSKSLSWNNQCIYFVSAVPVLFNMDSNKYSNLFSYFSLLQRIGCTPKLLRMIISLHEGMQGTVQYDGSSSDPFPIRNGVKQGSILTPTLLGTFFSLLLPYTPSVSQKKAYTSAQEAIETSSALHASEQGLRCEEYWLGSCLFEDNTGLTAHWGSSTVTPQLLHIHMWRVWSYYQS